jgi:glyoxylate utilization-related uncharacterized protein
MKLDDLLARGAYVVCGNVDADGINLGTLLADGDVLLTPAGETWLAEKAEAAEVKPKTTRRRAAAEPESDAAE